MTESSTVAAGSMHAPSPGAVLRRARQAQGLHIAALAAALKVTPRKLELLEGDEFHKLPDIAFARALAQAVCRHLKIDAPPVLALFPAATTAQPALERVTQGLQTPFREYSSQRHESGESPVWLQLRFVVPALLVLAALAFLLVPNQWIPRELPWQTSAAPAVDTPVAEAVMPPQTTTEILTPVIAPIGMGASSPVSGSDVPPAAPMAASALAAAVLPAATPEAAAPVPGPASSTPMPMPLPPGMLAVRTASQSWVEVVDGAGDTLISRVLAPGEAIAVNGEVPMRLTVGNAAGMQVRFKGQPVVMPMAPDRTARTLLR